MDESTGDTLGGSTEAIRAGGRDRGAISKEDAMTLISDIAQTWPEAIVDVGPVELGDHYWGGRAGGGRPHQGILRYLMAVRCVGAGASAVATSS